MTAPNLTILLYQCSNTLGCTAMALDAEGKTEAAAHVREADAHVALAIARMVGERERAREERAE